MRPSEHRRTLVHLALPVYLELLSNVVSGIVDTFWIAGLGGAAVAAVSLATNLENVLLGVILSVSLGMTVLVASRMGRQDLTGVRRAVSSGWLLWALLTPVVAIAGFLWREPIIRLFAGASGADVVKLAGSFLAITFPGLFVFYGQNVVDAAFKGNKDTKTPMKMAMVANVANLILDPLLIYGWAGMPKLGVQGAALATLLGRSIALAVALYLSRRSALNRALASVERHGPDLATIRQTLSTGLPMSGDFLARMGGSMVLLGIIARFGVNPLAAFGVGTKVLVFVTMLFYGLRQASSIHTARRIGEGQRGEVRSIGLQTILVGLVASVLAGLGIIALAPNLIRIFLPDSEVVAVGATFLRYMAVYLLPLGIYVSLGGILQGAQRSSALFGITLTGLTVQLGLALVLSSLMRETGVWIAMIAGATVQAAMMFMLFQYRLVPAMPEPFTERE